MAKCSTAWASCSTYIKVATVTLSVVLLLYLIGFSLPRWCTVEITVYPSKTKSGYHAGLWQHCGCTEVLDSDVCVCISRSNEQSWMKLVQGLETLCLIGYVIAVILSFFLICNHQHQQYKTANFFIITASGTIGLIGTILFGVQTTDEFEDINKYSGGDKIKVGHGQLSYAFYLCAFSHCICLLACGPLYIKELCSAPRVPYQEATVYYTPQPLNYYPQGGLQQAGNLPYHTPAPCVTPPPYEHQYQRLGGATPYKS